MIDILAIKKNRVFKDESSNNTPVDTLRNGFLLSIDRYSMHVYDAMSRLVY